MMEIDISERLLVWVRMSSSSFTEWTLVSDLPNTLCSSSTVVGPHIPSTGSPVLRWKSLTALTVSGPNMPSTLPASNPSEPSLFCNIATSSPRIYGDRMYNRRSPRRNPASSRVFQVCGSHSPLSGKARDCWKARSLSDKVPLVKPKACRRVDIAASLLVNSGGELW